MLPVYLETCGVTWKFTPKKVTVHFKACWSSSQNTWWILIWLAVLDMICNHRNGTIFPNDSPIFFREQKTTNLGACSPAIFLLSSWRWCASVAYRWASSFKPTVVGVPCEKKSGCQGVRVGFHDVPCFFWLNASWAHPAPTFRVSSRSIEVCGFGSLEVRGWSFSGGDWDHQKCAASSRVFGADLSFVWWFNAGILLKDAKKVNT